MHNDINIVLFFIGLSAVIIGAGTINRNDVGPNSFLIGALMGIVGVLVMSLSFKDTLKRKNKRRT